MIRDMLNDMKSFGAYEWTLLAIYAGAVSGVMYLALTL